MAGSLLALLDDISTLLDDVSLLAKAAAQKTTGVIGDDLALNAQQVAGVRAERELPVVFAVAMGSLLNKAILVPAALAISTFAPWAITALLMAGGAFLCFEGFEKVAHRFLGNPEDEQHHRDELARAHVDETVDLRQFERDKIRGAVRTDFVLSAEIIAITLGIVADAELLQQLIVLASVAVAMTVGVYGVVALIVKLDDMGLWLAQRPQRALRVTGRGVLRAAPMLMKALSVLGTIAMFMVGGGILVHGVGPLHHWIEASPPWITVGFDILFGLFAGAVVLAAVSLVRRVAKRS